MLETIGLELLMDLIVASVVFFLMKGFNEYLRDENRYYRKLVFKQQQVLLSKLGVEDAKEVFDPTKIGVLDGGGD